MLIIQLQDQVLRTGAIQVPLPALATGPELPLIGVAHQEPRPGAAAVQQLDVAHPGLLGRQLGDPVRPAFDAGVAA